MSMKNIHHQALVNCFNVSMKKIIPIVIVAIFSSSFSLYHTIKPIFCEKLTRRERVINITAFIYLKHPS